MDSKKNRPEEVLKYKKLLEEGYDEDEAQRIAGVSMKSEAEPEASSSELNKSQDPNSDT